MSPVIHGNDKSVQAAEVYDYIYSLNIYNAGSAVRNKDVLQ